jgi:hypothetical protein
MRLLGSRWKELNLLSVAAMYSPGSLWKEMKLASAAHLFESFAMPLPGNLEEELTSPAQCMYSNRLQCICQEAAGKISLDTFAMHLPRSRREELSYHGYRVACNASKRNS